MASLSLTQPFSSAASGLLRPGGTHPRTAGRQVRVGRRNPSSPPCPALKFSASTATPSKTAATRKDEWVLKRKTLLDNKVLSLSAQDAAERVASRGFKILDVRPEGEFAEVHAVGSVNAQFFRLIKEWTAWDNLRRAGFAFFGVFNGTEENPQFLEDAAKVLSKEDKVIVACLAGGTLKPTTNFPLGKESRSLSAAVALVNAGYKEVYHLEGGLMSYFQADLPVELKDDE